MVIENDLLVSQNRKKEHLKYFTDCKSHNSNGFENITLQNNSLPEINFDEICTSVNFIGKKLDFPIIINAITGGFDEAIDINYRLAELANKFNIAMAVGSQSIAVKASHQQKSYQIVRDTIKDGVVISNLSANCSLDNAYRALEMLNADAIQLHLNCAQEIFMLEGDRNFKGITDNIKNIVKNIKKPVIVKEVGFGISEDAAKRLFDIGVKYIDIGGKGGTNFIEIENLRTKNNKFAEFYDWGIPTAESLLQCVSINRELSLIASGGITKADEIIKALCMGADMVAISGIILKVLLKEGYDASENFLSELIEKAKILMLLIGADSVKALRNKKIIRNG